MSVLTLLLNAAPKAASVWLRFVEEAFGIAMSKHWPAAAFEATAREVGFLGFGA